MIDEQIYYLRWSRVSDSYAKGVDEQLSTPCPWQPKEIPNKSCREDLHTVAAWIQRRILMQNKAVPTTNEVRRREFLRLAMDRRSCG